MKWLLVALAVLLLLYWYGGRQKTGISTFPGGGSKGSFLAWLRSTFGSPSVNRVESAPFRDSFISQFGPGAQATKSFENWVNSFFSYKTVDPWTGITYTSPFGQTSPNDASQQNPFNTFDGVPYGGGFGGFGGGSGSVGGSAGPGGKQSGGTDEFDMRS